jgi:hypothetical protein
VETVSLSKRQAASAVLTTDFRRLVRLADGFTDGDEPPIQWLMEAALTAGLRAHGIRGLASKECEWMEAGKTLAGSSAFRPDGRPAEIDLMGGYVEHPLAVHPALTSKHVRRLAEEFLSAPDTDGSQIFLSGLLAGYRDERLDGFIVERVEERLHALRDGECGDGDACLGTGWLLEAIRYFGDPRPTWRLYVHTDAELDDMEDADWSGEIWERAKGDLEILEPRR